MNFNNTHSDDGCTEGTVVKNIARGAGGLGLDSQAVQIGRSAACGSPLLQRIRVAQALNREEEPRHS